MDPTRRTAEQTETDNIAAMGELLGKQYSALWQEVVWVHRIWREYVDLYGTSESRIKLLNQAAAGFFRIVQDALWEQTLLNIAWLTDAPRSAGKPNLSIQSILTVMRDSDARKAVTTKVEEALVTSRFCRDWRNRRIAHRDLDLAIREQARPLEPASRAQVQIALDRIADVLNVVSLHYLGTETYFKEPLLTGGRSLLYLLDSALELREEKRQRLERGEFRPGDFRDKEL